MTQVMYKDVITNYIKDEIIYGHLAPFVILVLIINFILTLLAFSLVQAYNPFHTPLY